MRGVDHALHGRLAEHFGTASFGTVRGLMTPLVTIAGTAAARTAGEVFDCTGATPCCS